MNGIINILKPPGMTSFDIVARVRGLLRIKKTGHTGTLDPMAVGVLPVCTGTATKAIEYIINKDKLYRAELTLGITTDTQDSSGELLEEHEVLCSNEEIMAVINSFQGKSQQLPPMYSAIKVNGRKLYEMAREGLSVDREPREIEIYSVNVLDINRCGKVRILFDVHCSKGTYIRTLCNDIGLKLGCGGHMSFLLRKKAGFFDLSTSITLEELKDAVQGGYAESMLLNTDMVFFGYKEIILDTVQEKKFLNGMALVLAVQGDLEAGFVKVYNNQGIFLALGEIFKDDGRLLLKSRKFF